MTESFQIEQKFKSILLGAIQQNASDVHFAVGKTPLYRIDGKLISVSENILSEEDTKAISKLMLNEEKSNKLIEDGQIGFSYNFENKKRFRTNLFFQKGFLSIVMRIIHSRIRPLEELSLPDSLYEFADYPQGLVLITGPVGHGKSTTMAALIDYINHNDDKHILTIEDPIEFLYQQDRCLINQREVGQDARSFPAALKEAFRNDVNVIMIGEMRDLETIKTVITAAETGHLIFATLHTNNSAETIDRIVDVFPSHQQNQIRVQLANVLTGIISQRLIPKIGGDRVPALEILRKNNAIENLIRENRAFQINSVIETGMKDGMISLDRSLEELAKKGLITAENAYKYAINKEFIKKKV